MIAALKMIKSQMAEQSSAFCQRAQPRGCDAFSSGNGSVWRNFIAPGGGILGLELGNWGLTWIDVSAEKQTCQIAKPSDAAARARAFIFAGKAEAIRMEDAMLLAKWRTICRALAGFADTLRALEFG